MRTGAQNPALRRQLLSQGVDAYLDKPLVFSELVALVRQYIEPPESVSPSKPVSPR